MPRERMPFKREYKGEVIIDFSAIFRNPDIKREIIKELKKLKPKNKNK